MIKFRAKAAILSGLIALTTASAQPDVERESLTALVDQLADASLSQPGGAGLSVCISLDGQEILCKGYGFADVVAHRPVEPDTVFHACSVSKQFLAAALMRLVERGSISLDDPITRYIPEAPVHGRTITLRHLLSHTSGLKGYTEVEAFAKLEDRPLIHDQILALLKDQPPLFEPGERFVYCNTGSYLLGMVVERVSGQPYGQFAAKELFGPAGLRHTAFDPASPDAAACAKGHINNKGATVPTPAIAWENAFAGGGVTSTARDLVAWHRALLAGAVLKPESYRQLTTPQTMTDGTPTGYGLYWYVRQHHDHRVVFHTGTGPGCSAWLAHYPDDHLTIAVMSNGSACRAPRVGYQMAMTALHVNTFIADEPVSAALLRHCSGRFQFEPWEDTGKPPDVVRFFEKDGKLHIDAGDGRLSPLLYQGRGVFVVAADHDYTITFPEPSPGTNPDTPALTCIGDNQIHPEPARRLVDPAPPNP